MITVFCDCCNTEIYCSTCGVEATRLVGYYGYCDEHKDELEVQ